MPNLYVPQEKLPAVLTPVLPESREPGWHVREVDLSAVGELKTELKISDSFARILYLRGLQDPVAATRFLQERNDLQFLRQIIPCPEMAKAVKRLKQAIEDQEPLYIYGDYDCDGVTSAALLYRYLKAYTPAVKAYLPDRFEDGYGLKPHAVDRIAAEGVKLILTCDNGISAFPAAERCKELGIDLIITDHHHRGDQLPEAYALVHPQVGFPEYETLTGVGVAFLLVIALEGGYNKRLSGLLDLVAIGTIADVASLMGPNRALVWKGIEQIRRSDSLRMGLQALLDANPKMSKSQISSQDIAFNIVPLINASGRLKSPTLAFDLLTSSDPEECKRLAQELVLINEDRKRMTTELEKLASDLIDQTLDLDEAPFIVLADERFHHGITGIVAGKLKDKYRCPVLLLSPHEDKEWKGSGRSPADCHLYEALHSVKDLLIAYGGHAQAAGCSLRMNALEDFKRRLNEYVRQIGWTRPPQSVHLDAEVPLRDLSLALCAELERLEPTGQGNPKPLFGHRDLQIISRKPNNDRHLFIRVTDGETQSELKAWGKLRDLAYLDDQDWIHASYRLSVNVWNGRESAQLTLSDIDLKGHLESPNDPSERSPEIVDCRQTGDRAETLRSLITPDSVLYVGHPALAPEGLQGKSLITDWQKNLPPCEHLICWEPPSDTQVWFRLKRRAKRISLLWNAGEMTLPTIDGSLLQQTFQFLCRLKHLTWTNLLAQEWPIPSRLVYPVVSILREVGLIAYWRSNYWEILQPDPQQRTSLKGLKSYQIYLESLAWQRDLKAASADQAKAILS